MSALIKGLKLANQVSSRSPMLLYTTTRNRKWITLPERTSLFAYQFFLCVDHLDTKFYVIKTLIVSDWNKDFKPAPYPTTEEERVAAAKKYNLLPQEYKPYPDDGMGYGDYPHLPDVSNDLKDPYYPYDMPDMKRNFNEPVKLISFN